MSSLKRQLFFTIEALDDIRDSLLFAAREWDLDAASFYRKMLDDTLESVAKFPIWSQIKDEVQEGVKVTGAGHHVIFLRPCEEDVHILRMLHYRMNETHYWDVM